MARLVRSNLVQVLGREYILTARAKGLSERIVLFRHALRNALIPVITMVGLQFGNMMASAVVVEVLFAPRGPGAAARHLDPAADYPLIQGTILVFAVVYIFLNLVIDLLYSVVRSAHPLHVRGVS